MLFEAHKSVRVWKIDTKYCSDLFLGHFCVWKVCKDIANIYSPDQQLSAICLHTHSEHASRPAGLAVSVTIRVDEEAGDAAVVGSDAKVKLLNPGSPVTVTSQVVWGMSSIERTCELYGQNCY